MANEITRGGIGNVWVRQESSIGSSSASWQGVRCDGPPTFPTSTQKLVANHQGGHRNPMTRELPGVTDQFKPDSLSLKMRLHRASTDGNTPIISTFFQAAGWQEDVATGATTTAGTPAVDAIDVAADSGLADGMCTLIEVTPGVFYPVLISDFSTPTIEPSIPISAAPAASEIVEICHGLTPTTLTGYEVPTDKTLQLRYNTQVYHDDAVGDGSFLCTGCALSSVGALEMTPNNYPTLEYTFHVGDAIFTPDDIAADSFQDSAGFVFADSSAQFAIANASTDGTALGTLTTKFFQKLTFNFGITVTPVIGVGAGGINGVQAYVLKQSAPTVDIEAVYTGDTDYTRKFLDELHDDNTRQYIHFIQPTTNLDHPAMGVWMPKCHLAPDKEPTIDATGDFVKINASFEATTAAWGGNDDIDEITGAPIVLGISGEAA